MRIAVLLLLTAAAGFGCVARGNSGPVGGSSGSGGSFSNGGSGGIQSSNGGSGSGGSGFGGDAGSIISSGPGGSSGGNDDCSDAAKLIYILSDANDLYSFKPDDKQFKKLGPLNCPTSLEPGSMAVDRDAIAWVNYVDYDELDGEIKGGEIFKVNTASLQCEPTSIKLSPGFLRMGMGFSSDDAAGSETLFVAGSADYQSSKNPGLGKIDLAANSVKPVGPFTGSLAGQDAELTGTGDGRLFGFFTTNPVKVAKINKGTGEILSSKSLPEVEVPAYFAFSFWGGDFYFYTCPDPYEAPNRTSNVTRYRPSDNSVDPAYMTNIGFRIVGAGVSTCAPLEPPK
jgi:hypothetical protein